MTDSIIEEMFVPPHTLLWNQCAISHANQHRHSSAHKNVRVKIEVKQCEHLDSLSIRYSSNGLSIANLNQIAQA